MSAVSDTGDTVTVQAIGATYEVFVRGIPVLGYNDTAGVPPVGANNRSFAFGSEYYWSGCSVSSASVSPLSRRTTSNLRRSTVSAGKWSE